MEHFAAASDRTFLWASDIQPEYSAFVVSAAVGAQRSHAGIWNPGPLAVLIWELHFVTTTSTSNTIAGLYTVSNVAPFTQDATLVRANDLRNAVPSPVVAISTANAVLQADSTVALRRAFLGTNQPRDFRNNQIIVVPAGRGVVVVPDAVATEIRAGFLFRQLRVT